jgi:MHS family proline/betaine transporter-like MFS transporter
MQSFAYSGEYTGSIIYLVEHAPANKKAFYGSMASLGNNLGIMFACVTCLILSYRYSQQQLQHYAWRLPFLLSLAFGIISLMLRIYLEEPAAFKRLYEQKKLKHVPLFQLIIAHWRQLLIITALAWLSVLTMLFSVYIFYSALGEYFILPTL